MTTQPDERPDMPSGPFVILDDGRLFVSLDDEAVAYGYSTHFSISEVVAAGVQTLLLAKGIAPDLVAQRMTEAAAAFKDRPSLTDPANIPGVESVTAKEGELVVLFKNGVHATVQRSPLSRFIGREAFDVYLPPRPDAGLIAAEVIPSKSAEEVLALLGKMAANSAGSDH